ncbi:MAG: hypothetical protein EBX50_18210, partial [Chitinophagia bacterium]|nr:hypothetical protein [Chitinophagia bacterium]
QNEKVIKDLETDNESLMNYIKTNPNLYELNQRILNFVSNAVATCEKSEKPDKIRVMKILFRACLHLNRS